MIYRASCHCGAVRFQLTSELITNGRRCNCSICIRKGVIMSARYYRPDELAVTGAAFLSVYRFGDHDVDHYFCATCGVSPFNKVAAVPSDYQGQARPGDYRVNLGCIEDFDALSLPIEVIDGRAF